MVDSIKTLEEDKKASARATENKVGGTWEESDGRRFVWSGIGGRRFGWSGIISLGFLCMKMWR